MNAFLKKMAIGACALVLGAAAFAAEKGMSEDAVAMVKKGVALVKADGKEKAFAEFNNPNGSYVKGDLYVMVYDMEGVNKAHGANPKLIGKNLLGIKDANGVLIVQRFIEVAQGAGKGWVDYRWPNNITKAVEVKSTYVEKVADVLIGVGIYK